MPAAAAVLSIGAAIPAGAVAQQEVPPPPDTIIAPAETLPNPFTGSVAAYYANLRSYLLSRHPGVKDFDPDRAQIRNNLEGGCEGFAGRSPTDPVSASPRTETGGIRKVYLRPLLKRRSAISVKIEIRPQVADTGLDGFDPALNTMFAVNQRFNCGSFGRRIVRLSLWKIVKPRGSRVSRVVRIRGRGTTRTLSVSGDAYGALATPVSRTVQLTDPGRKNRRRERWLVGISSGYTKHPSRYTAVLRVSARSRKTPYLRNPARDDVLNQG